MALSSVIMLIIFLTILGNAIVFFVRDARHIPTIAIGIQIIRKPHSLREMRLLLLLAPLSYFVERAESRIKERLEKVNQLYMCKTCDKYSREYQQVLLEGDCRCIHCGDTYPLTSTNPSQGIIDFLKDFPECPEIDEQGLRDIILVLESKSDLVRTKKETVEIDRILASYQESGNQYLYNITKNIK